MSSPSNHTVEDHRASIAAIFTLGTIAIGIIGFLVNPEYAKTIFTALLPVDAIFLKSYFDSKE